MDHRRQWRRIVALVGWVVAAIRFDSFAQGAIIRFVRLFEAAVDFFEYISSGSTRDGIGCRRDFFFVLAVAGDATLAAVAMEVPFSCFALIRLPSLTKLDIALSFLSDGGADLDFSERICSSPLALLNTLRSSSEFSNSKSVFQG